MNYAATTTNQRSPTSTPLKRSGVIVVKKHHLLVRLSHWLNVPLLLGLILSGISIYWASPIYQHNPDPKTGNFDVWRRTLEPGYAPMFQACISTAVLRIGFTTT